MRSACAAESFFRARNFRPAIKDEMRNAMQGARENHMRPQEFPPRPPHPPLLFLFPSTVARHARLSDLPGRCPKHCPRAFETPPFVRRSFASPRQRLRRTPRRRSDMRGCEGRLRGSGKRVEGGAGGGGRKTLGPYGLSPASPCIAFVLGRAPGITGTRGIATRQNAASLISQHSRLIITKEGATSPVQRHQ
jgi:hypothetical protein